MNLFKKIFIPDGSKEELVVYEKWAVRWVSRHGEFCSQTQKECEFFTKKEDAEKFKTQLEDAFKLVRNTSENNVELKKE